jgi:DNA modification methylase
MRSHEMIYVFSKKGATYYRTDIEGDFPNTAYGGDTKSNVYGGASSIHARDNNEGVRCALSVINIKSKAVKGNHPTQKPDDLYEWLITRYSKEGDTILDPTAGSFASCFTAQRLGRNAIGIEMDAGFYEKAKSRVEV